MKSSALFLLIIFIFSSCQEQKENSHQKHLGSMAAMAEMVAADVKPLALSEPMESAEVEAIWAEASAIAEKYGVEVFRETELIISMMFPESVADGKEV